MKNRCHLICFIGSLFFNICFSQHPIEEKQYFFKSITTEDGLSNNVVFDIHQDSDGYIWLATNNGLNRYNGYNVKPFFHSKRDSTSISSNVVLSIIEDLGGQLWVGTKNGLNRYSKDKQDFDSKIKPIDFGFPSNQVMSMTLDNSGKIWITNAGNIGRFDTKSLNIDAVKNYDAFMVDTTLENETIWISNANDDIYEYDIISGNSTKKASAVEMNTTHYGAQSKSLWIPKGFQAENMPLLLRFLPSLPDNAIPKYLIELNNRISWIGTNNGLYEYNYETKKLSKIPLGKSTLTNQIKCLYRDKGSGIWVGTLGGVFRYDPHRKVFKHNDIIEDQDDIVMALHRDETGIYANGLGNGIYFKPNNTSNFKEISLSKIYPDEGLFIWDFECVPESDFPFWMATNQGVICLNQETSDFKKLNVPLNSKDENVSFSICNTNQDFIWIASHRAVHKITKINGELLESFVMNDQIGYPGIQKIITLKDHIYIATENNGLFKFSLKTKQFSNVYQKENNQILESPIWDLYVAENILWIGANDGLYQLNPDDLLIEPVLEENHVVFSIIEDESKTLWLGTDKGIKSYDPDTHKSKFYTTIDGLKNIEFNRKSVIKDSLGNLWFGGVNGITSFNPKQVKKDNPNIPNVHIVDVRVATSDSTFSLLDFKNNITLPWKHNTIELDYVGLNYTNSPLNKYRYTLQGHDPNWVTVAKPITARYVKLPVGTYNFKVTSANSDGVWNTEGENLEITIKPPFWRTNTAYIVYVLSFIGLIRLFRRLKLYRNRIFQVEQEKEVIAKKVEQEFIVLNNKTKVYLKDLKFIKAAGNYLEFHTIEKVILDRNKLKLLEDQLPPNFIRTHRSYIINKNYIISANSASVFIKPNLETPLSRSFKGSLK